MANAPFGMPLLMSRRRFAANGMIPQALFAQRAAGNLAHLKAHRRKVFGRWGAVTGDGMVTSDAGTQTIWRTLVQTGVGASHVAFLVGFLPAPGNASGQRLEIDLDDGGGAVTYAITPGDRTGTAAGSPNEATWRTLRAPVAEDTVYSIEVRKLNGCRPVSFLCYEQAPREADENLEIGIGEPVTDAFRQTLLDGYAAAWKKNASHLISWLGTKDGTSPTESGTAWVNVIDGNATITANTAGFYLGDGTTTLEQWCRVSSNKTLDVVLAAHGSCAGGSTGEVRLANSGGTLCSVTGIGSTSQWWTTTTTIAAIDTVSKADLQFRVAAGGSTLTLNAVSLFAYLV